MPIWPFRRSRAQADAERLLDTVVAVSRNPAFFGAGRAPDTLEGRFEMMTLIASLALIRLQREPEMEPLAQAFTDKLFRHFDAGLREAGTSDTAVPKRMHKLAGDFYGRLKAYAAALEAGEAPPLSQAITRNLGAVEAGPLAAYALDAATAQRSAPASALLEPDGWPSLAR